MQKVLCNLPVTATFEVTGVNEKGGKEQQFKRAYHHALHDPNEKHLNEDILYKYTALQLHDDYAAGERLKQQLLHDLCTDYVVQHDKKMIEQRKPSKCFHDVDTYVQRVKKQNKSFCRRVIGTFGNYDTMQYLYDAYGEDKVRAVSAHALAQFVDDFNTQHDHVKIVHYVTNSDEKGAPHVHMQMLGLSKSAKTGKPSVTFNNALRDEFGGKGGKDTMALFRASVDKQLVNTFDRVLHEEIGQSVPKLTLLRLNPDNDDKGIDFNVYKGAMTIEDDVSEREKKIQQLSDDLSKREKKIQQEQQTLESKHRQLALYQKQVIEQQKQLHQQEIELARKKAEDEKRECIIDDKLKRLHLFKDVARGLYDALYEVNAEIGWENSFKRRWHKSPYSAIKDGFFALKFLADNAKKHQIKHVEQVFDKSYSDKDKDIDIDL